MRFCYALVSSFAFASVAIAHSTRDSNSRIGVVHHRASTSSNVEYNQYWSGAHYENSGETFSYVTATLQVPVVTGDNGSGGYMTVEIIDNGCSGSFIQAGIGFFVDNGETTYGAFADRDLDSISTDGLTVSGGDRIKTSITTLTATSAVVDFENLTRNQHLSAYLNSTDDTALCGEEVMWALRRRSDGTSLNVAPPRFSTAAYMSASANGSSGTIEPDRATLVNMREGSTQLTSVSAGGSTMTIIRL